MKLNYKIDKIICFEENLNFINYSKKYSARILEILFFKNVDKTFFENKYINEQIIIVESFTFKYRIKFWKKLLINTVF